MSLFSGFGLGVVLEEGGAEGDGALVGGAVKGKGRGKVEVGRKDLLCFVCNGKEGLVIETVLWWVVSYSMVYIRTVLSW